MDTSTRPSLTKALILGYVWPEPESSAAGLRTWNLVDTITQAGFQLAFSSSANENRAAAEMRRRGISTHSFRPNDSSFDSFIQEFQPDYVIFDRFVTEEQFGWRVEENSPRTIRILDTQDLHFLRRARQKALTEGLSLPDLAEGNFNLLSEDCLRELASIYRCDGTLILSAFEFQLLQTRFEIPTHLLHLSRFHYPLPPADVSSFEERKNFVMIGNFRHAPNADGVEWFCRRIWPLLRQKTPDAQVHIYGAYPSKEMMSYTDRDNGIFIKGPTPDQFETLKQYRVNLAPLRFGAGIKGKITDGWWCGTPVVTTPIGREGMADTLPWGGEIAHTEREFAEKAALLYTEPLGWNECRNRGYHIINSLYSKSGNSEKLIQFLQTIRDNLNHLRKSNLTGMMLRHHFHKSTKYLSKWIEEKSKTSNRTF